jgi:hypothetical protein
MDSNNVTDLYEVPGRTLEIWAGMLPETEIEEGDFGGMVDSDYEGYWLGYYEEADPYVGLWREYQGIIWEIDNKIKDSESPEEREHLIFLRRENRKSLVRKGRELQDEHRWHGEPLI